MAQEPSSVASRTQIPGALCPYHTLGLIIFFMYKGMYIFLYIPLYVCNAETELNGRKSELGGEEFYSHMLTHYT